MLVLEFDIDVAEHRLKHVLILDRRRAAKIKIDFGVDFGFADLRKLEVHPKKRVASRHVELTPTEWDVGCGKEDHTAGQESARIHVRVGDKNGEREEPAIGR